VKIEDQIEGQLGRFERDPAGASPAEVKALFCATHALYPDGAVDEDALRALRHRYNAALKARADAKRSQPKVAPRQAPVCRIYEETPTSNAEILAAMQREVLAQHRRIRQAARLRRTSYPGRRVRGRSRCRRDAKSRSSARSGDGPDGEPEPGEGPACRRRRRRP
jgi:hypothetical protein